MVISALVRCHGAEGAGHVARDKGGMGTYPASFDEMGERAARRLRRRRVFPPTMQRWPWIARKRGRTRARVCALARGMAEQYRGSRKKNAGAVYFRGGKGGEGVRRDLKEGVDLA